MKCATCATDIPEDSLFCPACGARVSAEVGVVPPRLGRAPAAASVGEAPAAVATAPSASRGALCAVHPDQPAMMTCSRCGSFACRDCMGPLQGTAALCVRCAALTGTPWAQIVRVAKAQRLVIGLFAVSLLGLPMSFIAGATVGLGGSINFIWIPVALGLRVATAVAVYRLAAALGSKLAVLWAIGSIVPNCIGFVVLLVISNNASEFLKKNGISVGFLGTTVPETPPPGRA
jgi:hypothetical protein